MMVKHNTWSGTRCWTSKETCYQGCHWNNVGFILDNIIVLMSKFLNVIIVLWFYGRMFLF